MVKVKGVYAAIPTPLTKDGEIIEESLKAICERIIATGMQGILVCGSTGEYPLLTIEERKKAVILLFHFEIVHFPTIWKEIRIIRVPEELPASRIYCQNNDTVLAW